MGERRLGYGFWRYQAHETETALKMLECVRSHGIDHLDTADIYGGASGFGGAERLLGEVRRQAPCLFEGAELATKAGVERGSPYNSSSAYLVRACEASLARLSVERIDLFYIHRPDLLIHPDDLAGTLDVLVEQGKVASIGVSNFTPAQIDALRQHLTAPLRASQIEFSAAHVAPIFDDSLDQAMKIGLEMYAWSPLAGGRLMSDDAGVSAVRAAIASVAVAHGASLEATALGFLLTHPASVTPIIGTKDPGRLKACADSRALMLERAEWYGILEAARGERMP
jgi:predicted oxidoreductase